jgi:hypothetical protein
MASGRAYLDGTPPSRQADRLRRHVRTGRPLGDEKLLAAVAKATGRKPGRNRTRSGEHALSEQKRNPEPVDPNVPIVVMPLCHLHAL